MRLARAAIDTVRAKARWNRMQRVAARAAWRSGTRNGGSDRNDRDPARLPHLAVLLQTFPPEVAGGVYRPLALAKYAALFGWRVTILAGRIRQKVGEAGEYLLRHLPKDAVVRRPEGPELRPVRRLLPRLEGGPMGSLELFDLGGSVLRSDLPDVLLATGPPFNSFVAGRHLADAFSVPLILDYRDEWTVGTPAFVTLGAGDRAFETACLGRADQVVFVTESIERLYRDAFPFLEAARCRTIRNGWDPGDVTSAEALDGDGAGTYSDAGPDIPTILHAGTLGAHMTPGVFLEPVTRILARREDLRRGLRICFIGNASGEAPAQLAAFPFPDVLEATNRYLPKPETLARMRRAAAVLLLNGPKLERVIPGKFYEYLATGAPILVHGDAGEIAEIMRELEAGWIVPIGDDVALEAALERVAARSPRPGDPARIAAWLDLHTREAMSRRFFAVADEARRLRR
jgi:glycosyltransferase involved in cell wall biosynthesis